MTLWAGVLGLLVGTFGTLVGAGGGFLLVPILLAFFPELPAAEITAISMLVVLFNAGSGSITYVQRRQVHWLAAWTFSAAAIPGIYLGLLLGQLVDRHQFEFVFGTFLALVALFLFGRSGRRKDETLEQDFQLSWAKLSLGAVVSLGVGILASFLGIGGGIIHVPLLSEVIGFPVHLATGTSHFILALTSVFAVVDHYREGHYSHLPTFVPFLIGGVVVGAQLGARLSKRISSRRILQVLSLALFLVGVRLVVGACKT